MLLRRTERIADPARTGALPSLDGWRYSMRMAERTPAPAPEPEVWERTFAEKRLLWGLKPARSAVLAMEAFVRSGVKTVLVPGVGYGRNAKVFVDQGMTVTGIEISESAIALARSELGLDIRIHHGSVTDMPFDPEQYDGIFCHGLLYLLDAAARAKVLRDCYAQLAPGGSMVFTLISKKAPMFGKGTKLGEDWYEPFPGVTMFFYDEASVQRELGAYGLVEQAEIEEPAHGGSTLPFIHVFCRKP